VYPLKTLKGRSAIFYIIISKKYTILKSLQGLQGHQGHTHTQTKTRLKTFLNGLQEFSGKSNGGDGNINENKIK